MCVSPFSFSTEPSHHLCRPWRSLLKRQEWLGIIHDGADLKRESGEIHPPILFDREARHAMSLFLSFAPAGVFVGLCSALSFLPI